ncbi:hypothetical protein SK355_14225 [Candidatus Fukatsuia symbiotica]|uniref:Uncharacterized protein n=2 Tax=Candidatus Fukatsuia symbiotica TaxID=1878942 RepID=A0A2U8I7N0_9GAMM|nr:hypothetical protein [Candidatus Fukatsuia symbiotica]AWK14195.1 hypothetical protein CCS41_06410 [Candidatus Fukatsuia symbiotica]MEA9446298.1 hypothetical protein [Candidatus Fukatsuia symbiotica]
MLGFEGNFLVSSQLYFHGYEHDPYRLQNQASSLITGIKPLETSRLAALALQKLFNHPFKNEMMGIGKIGWDERGWEVFRADQVLAQLGRSKLKPQVSYHLVSDNDHAVKERLLAVNHHARLAAWKENAFLQRGL